MAFFQIPIRTDIPSYDFQIDLEGVLYTLGFSFNGRGQYWVMDILDANENPLLMGIKVITGWLLTDRFSILGLPPGNFYVSDSTGRNEDPTQNDFGTTKIMIYADSTEIPNGQ